MQRSDEFRTWRNGFALGYALGMSTLILAAIIAAMM